MYKRQVLTEHSKPVKSWAKEILGRFDPLAHKLEVQTEVIKERIKKGAQLSERLAKLLFIETKDKLFKEFFVERTRTATTKKEEKK